MLLFLIFINSFFSVDVLCDTNVYGSLFGDGVCSIHREDRKLVLIIESRVEPEMSYSLCWDWPPWCKTPDGRMLEEFLTVPENIKHEILSLKCCQGYFPSKDKLSCLPFCSPFCRPNKCVSPNNCSECQTGYHGSTCIEDASPNKTTTLPTPRICDCPNENYMCTSDFRCVCMEGFDGDTCQHIIPPQPIIIKPDICLQTTEKVGLIVLGLVLSAGFIAFLMKKRVFWRNTFEPLDDRNVPVI